MDPRLGPVRAFRDGYVAPFAGLSYDLAPGAVGVALAPEGSELEGRRVLASAERGPARSLAKRPSFTVVALSRLMRNARELAAWGGIVFSTWDLEDDDAAPFLGAMKPGDSVFLNAALDRLPAVAVRRPFSDPVT